MEFSAHCQQMLKERAIPLEWVELTLNDPDRTEEHPDGTRHYLKQISAHGHRWLRLVMSMTAGKPTCITLFFDRRLKKKP